MTDQNEVASPNAEENESDTITLDDIRREAGIELFDNAEDESPEATEEEQETESAEVPEAVEVSEPTEETEGSSEVSEADTEGVKKRIGKLIEAREQAKQEVEELKEELQKVRQDKPDNKPRIMTGLEKFDNVATIQELQQREDDAEHLREWLLQNPEGGEYVDQSGSEHEVDYEKAKELIVETDRDLRKNIPYAKARMAERHKQDAIALNTFRWMGNKSTQEYYHMSEILQNNQYLSEYAKKDPHAMIVLGYAVEGFKKIAEGNKPKQQQALQAPKVPVAPKNAKPQVVKKRTDKTTELLQKAKTGKFDDAVNYIESLL